MEKIILTREEISRIEAETEKKYGISMLILMENAGRMLAEITSAKAGNIRGKRICIFAGKGNNGGDGFVAARYLFNMGAEIKVFHMGCPEQFSKISFTNYNILCKMDIDVFPAGERTAGRLKLECTDIVIDALFGTGIKGEIEGPAKEIIKTVNRSGKYIVCADIPSGLNANTGKICGTAVKGNTTVSFGFAKKGFYISDGPEHCGTVEIADIGFPRFFYGSSGENQST